MFQFLVRSISQLNDVLKWNAHHLCSLHGISEVVDYLRQTDVGQIVRIIFFITHNEAKLRFLAELLFWQVFTWLTQFIFELIQFIKLRLVEAEEYPFSLFYFILFVESLLTDLFLLLVKPLQQLLCLVLIYVQHRNL